MHNELKWCENVYVFMIMGAFPSQGYIKHTLDLLLARVEDLTS